MTPLLMAVVAIIALPSLGAVLGFAQLAVYRQLVARGRMTDDDVPFFGILMLRGMIAGFALTALMVILLPHGDDPLTKMPLPAATKP